MRPKPNRTYSSDDLVILSRPQGGAERKNRCRGSQRRTASGSRLSLPKVILDRITAGETDPEALKQAAVESVGAR